MTETAGVNLIGLGVYTLPQAARLAGVPVPSIRRWLYGYKYKYRGEQIEQPAVVTTSDDFRALSVLTFRDLIEIQFVHAFHKEGVSWKTIRFTAAKASLLTGADHPFASRQFVTDGKTIFAEIAQATGNKELLDLRNDQMAFRRVFLPSLRSKLEVGERGVERLWPMGKKRPIVIDPNRQFGQPISLKEGVPTEVLAKTFDSLRSIDAVSRWYNVARAAVRAAVDFEKSLVVA
jgi:uncharacterized protein (DUF433 family)